jgi:hypothetical protein
MHSGPKAGFKETLMVHVTTETVPLVTAIVATSIA